MMNAGAHDTHQQFNRMPSHRSVSSLLTRRIHDAYVVDYVGYLNWGG